MGKKDSFWDLIFGSSTKTYRQGGGTYEKQYPQQNLYKGRKGSKKHDHTWYDPGSRTSGWAGENYPRKRKR